MPVHGDRLTLDAADRAQHEHGAVEHAQRPLDLDGEVDVAGRVDDVYVVLLPVDVGGGRLDGDASLTLELHGVHGGAHLILALHFVHLIDAARVEEQTLGERRLARVDVCRYADVSYLFQIIALLHSYNVKRKNNQPMHKSMSNRVVCDKLTNRFSFELAGEETCL